MAIKIPDNWRTLIDNARADGMACLVGTADKAGRPQISPKVFVYDAGTLAYWEHELPFLTIMFNNQGYLSQKAGVPHYYPEGWAVKTNNFSGLHIGLCPEYAKIIEAFGGYGERVEEPGEVQNAIRRGLDALKNGRSALLDIRPKPVEEIVHRSDK